MAGPIAATRSAPATAYPRFNAATAAPATSAAVPRQPACTAATAPVTGSASRSGTQIGGDHSQREAGHGGHQRVAVSAKTARRRPLHGMDHRPVHLPDALHVGGPTAHGGTDAGPAGRVRAAQPQVT